MKLKFLYNGLKQLSLSPRGIHMKTFQTKGTLGTKTYQLAGTILDGDIRAEFRVYEGGNDFTGKQLESGFYWSDCPKFAMRRAIMNHIKDSDNWECLYNEMCNRLAVFG